MLLLFILHSYDNSHSDSAEVALFRPADGRSRLVKPQTQT